MSEGMTDEAFHAEIDELDKQGRYALAMVRATREADRARASETEKAAEIERMKAHETRHIGTIQEQHNLVLSLRADIERLNTELARLTPSGQVAEGMEAVRRALVAHGVFSTDTPHASLSSLAAQAQGYASAVARAEEAEKQACLAWERHAEKDRAYGDAISQRDAAVADNAALLRRLNEGARLVALLPPHGHEGDEETGQHDEDCEQCRRDALEAVLMEDQTPHPGAALLKERQEREDTIKALEGALTTIAERGVSNTDRRIARDALHLAGRLP